MPDLEEVLCPKCTFSGGLKIYTEYQSTGQFGFGGMEVREVLVLSCSLPGCNLILVGERQGDMAVFPDPHVQGGLNR